MTDELLVLFFFFSQVLHCLQILQSRRPKTGTSTQSQIICSICSSRGITKEREMEVNDRKGMVCVTGGTGYLASWLIMKLLQHGYSVNATIRSTQGCVGVFHIAHPMNFGDEEIEDKKIRRTVDGTLGVLQECLNSKTVKRVVYTSSRTALVFNDKGLDIVNESSWSDIHVMKTLKPISAASYVISKTLAEKAALEFAEKHGLDLITVIPSWIHGPFLSTHFPEPLRSAMAMIYGNQENCMKYPSLTPFVHVDDVASAHIFLLENSKAQGRYICSAVEVTPDELFKFLSARYPEYRIPNVDSLREIGGIKHPSLSSKKLLEAGFNYKYGLEEMFDGAIECCKQKGLL
ncbi:hypothetical protein CQW23_13272 [Capsicum baccatum]|uniref:Dihydroflavonol 4-reductase n=1 Tax=Capsicum baccatum TaxID=33114 RepID=A0A2G2WUZ0_CAPBA|nr:hypothetical protein CQW23_13272 [Capsicum baccatum]